MGAIKQLFERSYQDIFNISVEVRDPENQLIDMIEYIKKIANGGHSYKITVDPDSSDYKKDFYIDGDGAFHINDVKVDTIKKYKDGKVVSEASIPKGRVTINGVNKMLSNNGYPDIKFFKGNGYFYFSGGIADRFFETGIYGSPNLNAWSYKEIWRELKDKLSDIGESKTEQTVNIILEKIRT